MYIAGVRGITSIHMTRPMTPVEADIAQQIEAWLNQHDDKCECDMCEKINSEVCSFCMGTGEVGRMEQVYPGEPHQALTGTQACTCRLSSEEEENDDQE